MNVVEIPEKILVLSILQKSKDSNKLQRVKKYDLIAI